jgi:hypothetical protein
MPNSVDSASACRYWPSPLDVGRISTKRDFAEETEGPRLVTALTALADLHQRVPGQCLGIIEPVRDEARLAQMHHAE